MTAGWQPILTAPPGEIVEVGRYMRVASTPGDPRGLMWVREIRRATERGGLLRRPRVAYGSEDFTHWRPLPPPPKEKA